MATDYPIEIDDVGGGVRIAGLANFTDPGNAPAGTGLPPAWDANTVEGTTAPSAGTAGMTVEGTGDKGLNLIGTATPGDGLAGVYVKGRGDEGITLDSIGAPLYILANGGGAVHFFSGATVPVTMDGPLQAAAALAANQSPRLSQLSPVFTTISGALATQQFVSGAAAQVSTTADVEVHTPVTMNSLIATSATCKVELSPDNTTFSTLCIWTEPVGVAFAGSIIDVSVRVPAGWYLKLTTAQAVLGLSTYY